VRVSVKGECRVAEPARFVTGSGDSLGTFYGDVRRALHETVGGLRGELLVRDQRLLNESLLQALQRCGEPLGIAAMKVEAWEATPLGWELAAGDEFSALPIQ
jgi:hypothetical protein